MNVPVIVEFDDAPGCIAIRPELSLTSRPRNTVGRLAVAAVDPPLEVANESRRVQSVPMVYVPLAVTDCTEPFDVTHSRRTKPPWPSRKSEPTPEFGCRATTVVEAVVPPPVPVLPV